MSLGLLSVAVHDWRFRDGRPVGGIPPLPGTWPDAEHLSAEFARIRDAAGATWPVRWLREPGAHPGGLLAAWAQLYRDVPAGGTVWLTLSMHGSYVPDLDGDEADYRDEVWALSPGSVRDEAEYWQGGLLSDDQIAAFLAEHAARHLTVIVADLCHSATSMRAIIADSPLTWDVHQRGIPYGGALPDGRRATVRTVGRACSLAAAPVVFLAACAADQTSADLRVGGCARCQLSPPGLQAHMLDRHGALSYALLEAMRLDPDWHRLGFADLWARAMEWPRWLSLEQTPSIDYGVVCGIDPNMRVFEGLAG